MRHSLSYSHSDQSLLRDPDLDECWDGLVVPGTLATYYFEGTGGFVLTRRVPYVIDPRTPLLQTIEIRRPLPRASHLKLAEIHDPDVVVSWPEREIDRSHWQDGRWPGVVRRVLEFQTDYAHRATTKIDKYNALLAEAGREVVEAEPEDPVRLIPPYWAVDGVDDSWWRLTLQSIELASEWYGAERVLPILALRTDIELSAFERLLAQLPNGCREAFCWASNWDESDASKADADAWVAAVRAAERRGLEIRNLYGGYFSVLLTSLGLAGVNHGVGYSESRDARRLGATGAPPARYYMPALREFVTVPNAQPIIDHLPEEWACNCRVCRQTAETGRPLVGRLSVEGLKRHFLIARHREFARVDANLDDELANLLQVGEWVMANSRAFLPPEYGERLVRWATLVRRA